MLTVTDAPRWNDLPVRRAPQALSTTRRPISTSRPVASASGRKRAAICTTPLGIRRRSSASAPTTCAGGHLGHGLVVDLQRGGSERSGTRSASVRPTAPPGVRSASCTVHRHRCTGTLSAGPGDVDERQPRPRNLPTRPPWRRRWAGRGAGSSRWARDSSGPPSNQSSARSRGAPARARARARRRARRPAARASRRGRRLGAARAQQQHQHAARAASARPAAVSKKKPIPAPACASSYWSASGQTPLSSRWGTSTRIAIGRTAEAGDRQRRPSPGAPRARRRRPSAGRRRRARSSAGP